ncbi:MAG: dihydrofolate reductase family protein [Thermoplasmata archaeon]|nr:dihydrofolate reductase family protein [Thermoplasmata archaeon]MCI4358987.1 dihydrofolate reductase family protein [Thermoplasmata archaeon]
MTASRPKVFVNCAISLDGRLAYAGGRRAMLSGPEDLRRVQRLRAASSAILVGAGTVLADDPSLRVHWDLLSEPPGPGPVRIILDSMGRTPEGSRVLDGSQPTLIAVSERCERRFPATAEMLVAGRERVELDRLWSLLAGRGLRSVLVEGGGNVIASVLRSGSFDRVTVYVAPVVIGGRTAPSLALGPETPDQASAVPLRFERAEPLGAGVVLTYGPVHGSVEPGP